jgi:hypothetical protein
LQFVWKPSELKDSSELVQSLLEIYEKNIETCVETKISKKDHYDFKKKENNELVGNLFLLGRIL